MERNEKIVAGVAILMFLCGLVTITQAGISVENSVDISGTGIMDSYIDAQTDFMLSGQKYTESVKTPALGLFGISEINSRSEFSMYVNNESDISVESATISNYTAGKYCMRNYDLGTVQNLKVRGDSVIAYEFMADNFSSLMLAEGLTHGYTEYNIIAKDSFTFKKLYDENFEFDGRLEFNIESYIENQTYPGAGAEDWLGCP